MQERDVERIIDRQIREMFKELKCPSCKGWTLAIKFYASSKDGLETARYRCLNCLALLEPKFRVIGSGRKEELTEKEE